MPLLPDRARDQPRPAEPHARAARPALSRPRRRTGHRARPRVQAGHRRRARVAGLCRSSVRCSRRAPGSPPTTRSRSMRGARAAQGGVRFARELAEAVAGAQAILLVTRWREFPGFPRCWPAGPIHRSWSTGGAYSIGRASRATRGSGRHEGRAVLRWARDTAARAFGDDPEAARQHRLAADRLAPDALLRALRAQGLRPVPRLPRRPDPRVLPELRRMPLERLHAERRGQGPAHRAARIGHRRLVDHVRRHRAALEHRPAPARGAQYLGQDEMFLANYTDGLSDLPLDRLHRGVPRADAVASFAASDRRRASTSSRPTRTAPCGASRPMAGSSVSSTAGSSCSGGRSSTTCRTARSWSRSRSAA